MKFFCELKKIVDDSYDIEIGRGLSDTLISDINNGLCGRIKTVSYTHLTLPTNREV